MKGHTWWSYDDLERLGKASGGISCFVRKVEPTLIEPAVLKDEVIRPADIGSERISKEVAMSRLARCMPSECVDLPFPGEPGNSKFMLLNGWRARNLHEPGRTAWYRARWFLSKPVGTRAVRVRISCVDGANPGPFEVYINGSKVAEVDTDTRDGVASIPLTELQTGEIYSLEMKCRDRPKDLESGLFRVEELQIDHLR